MIHWTRHCKMGESWRKAGALYYLLGLLCVSHVLGLQFTSQPQSLDVPEGRAATLQCGVDSASATYKWTLNGQDLATGSGIVEDGNLKISQVNRELHTGEFICIAETQTEGPIESTGAELNILWISDGAKLSLKSPEDASQVQEGDRVTLTCKADGNPIPVYSFYRDRFELDISPRIEITDNKLKLKGATPDDSGTYSCKAANRKGETWSTKGNVTLDILDSNFPTIVTAPEDQIVVPGNTAIFNCKFSGDPSPPVEWNLYQNEENMGKLEEKENTHLHTNGTLVLENVSKADDGTYTCICKSEFGEPRVEAMLHVAYVEPLPALQSFLVKEGTSDNLNCSYPYRQIGGIPSPSISWKSPSSSAVSSDPNQRVHTVKNTLLVWNNIEKSDEGNYTCVAENPAGSVNSVLVLTVATIPVFTLTPSNVAVREVESAIIDCQADADPEPTIKWYRGDESIHKQVRGMRVMTNGSLVIYSANLGHNGTYRCEASNGAAAKSVMIRIIVEAILKFNPKPVPTPFELNVEDNLICHATAATKPKIEWIKEGTPPGTWPDHVTVKNNGELIFSGPKKSDAGLYTCIASTDLEKINITVKVEVYVKPKFTIEPENATGFERYSIIVDCDAYGDPPPTITWIGGNTKKDPDRFITLPNNSLLIEDIKQADAGKYTCVAGNDGGLNMSDFTLSVQRGSPVPPITPEVMTRTFLIAVGCAVAYILLFVFLMIWCKQRRRRRRMTLKEEDKPTSGPTGNGLNEYHDEEEGGGTKPENQIPLLPTAQNRNNYDKLQFPRHDLSTIAVIGHGAYGEVSIARAQGIRDGEEATTVLVKALETKDNNLQLNFRGEIDMLSKLDHDNVVKLLGICREAEPQLMITEYLDWGDLKQFLKATRGDNGTTNMPPPLTLNQKLDIINQVALGMEHLSNNRFVHADLAARNCLLSPSMEVKICTMSASKDLYRNEYHEYNQRLMPIRWMPAEAVFEDELSTKSDVWAYGVFSWEVFSQGLLPYEELSDDKIMSAMVNGELMLTTPPETPKEIEVLMQKCWAHSAKDRCSFAEIVLTIQKLGADSNV